MKDFLSRRWAQIKSLVGKGIFERPDVTCPSARLGSAQCGWVVATEGIARDSIVYSFGVGENASFDIGLIERFDVTVHAFDPTPRSIAWVKRQQLPDRFVMYAYGLTSFDGIVPFNPPENPNFVSHTMLDRPSTKANAVSLPVKRLDTVMKELGHEKLDILKMDIEGAEYGVIEDIAGSDVRPGQILVEFHHRFPGVGIDKTRTAIETLRAVGYRLFAVSPLNEDFCFVRHGK